MTITQFYSVLSQPNLVLTPQEHADLKSMIDQFPAFQLAKMLELKTLQLQDSTLFRNKLSKVAAQMPNREALFTLLYQQKPTKTKVEAPKVIEKPETISQEINLEALAKPTKTKVEAPKATEKTETISQEINLEALARLTKTKVEAPKVIEKPETISHEIILEAPSKPTKTKVEAPMVIEKPETISQEIKLEAPSKKEIIDQFIRTSPAIRRPETKVATDETPLVDHSIDEKYDLVSETLAELYLQQGAKEKAVKVYQKLILIYPEKSSFFAARIFEIQNNQ